MQYVDKHNRWPIGSANVYIDGPKGQQKIIQDHYIFKYVHTQGVVSWPQGTSNSGVRVVAVGWSAGEC